MLGTELELRLLNYRDSTPLKAGQVDDEPYGGGAGMVLRVDIVAAALDAAYGGPPEHRVVALTPQGRQLDQQLVEELAGEKELTLLSARFEGFDERIVEHLSTDAVSIGPYVLSGGEVPAMVLLDAIARRLPGALGSEESGLEESFSAELEGGLEYPHYTRPAEFRGWSVPEVLLSGDHGRIAEWRREQSRARTITLRNPIDALTHGLPRQWRIAIDWAVTILGADRDRARDQGLRRQSVPDPVLVDGADAALCAAALRLHVAVLRPRARESAHLPLPRAASAARSSSSRPRRGCARLRRRGRDVRQAADRPPGRTLA